jgi:putative acetyltransferase
MDISIRRAEPGDFEALARSFEDPSAYAGTLQLPYPSRELWRKRLAEPIDGDFILLAFVGDQLAGHAGLHPPSKQPRRSHAMNIGMAVPSQRQGKGAAIALYRKFGFDLEGTHKAYALRNGEYVDAHFMARLKPKRAVV